MKPSFLQAAARILALAFGIITLGGMLAVPPMAEAQSCVGTTGACFQGLGFLNPSATTPQSIAQGISPDGSTIVGWSRDSNNFAQAFKWFGGTMTGLGFLNPSCVTDCNSEASGINGQGLIVGDSTDVNGHDQAFQCCVDGMVGLGFLSNNEPISDAEGIAAQADVPVGQGEESSGPSEAVMYTGGTVVALGYLAPASSDRNSIAYGANASGQIIVGQSLDTNGKYQAFRWQGTMTGLGFLNATDTESEAFAANTDGSIIVGDSGSEAVRWVNGVISGLCSGGSAYAVNGNGTVVSGTCSSGPFRWTSVDGVQSIAQLLTKAGVALTGWSLGVVRGISADGATITGIGADPNGHQQGWIARVPLPSGLTAIGSHDFNDDGVSDILWRDTSGDLAMWLMQGGQNAGQLLSGATLGTVGTSWSVVGQRDFNDDGNADILWLDNAGDLAVWLMSGTTLSSGIGLGNVGTSWKVVGTGDFNGDGTGDILWRDSSGNVAIWLMHNGQFSSGTSLGQVGSAWSVAGTGDFNGDGTTDILWYNTQTGDVAIWLVNNGQVSSGIGLGNVGTSWKVVGTGDFNGDGATDILWSDSSGDYAIWLMSNGQFSSGATIASGVSNVWSVAETGDFNSDGKSDILWIDQSGDVGVWLMNGTTVGSTIGLGNVGTSWTVQGQNAD